MNTTPKPEAAKPNATRVANYRRHSDHPDQSEDSLVDQHRRCVDVARRHGLEIDPALIFSDAKSGKEELTERRAGYQAMLRAWDEGRFDVLIVDEVSRLGRGRVELAKLQDRIEKTHVRVITCDGLDSNSPTWGFTFAVAALMATHELAELKFRVTRGLIGRLERGLMIGYPGYGLSMTPSVSADGQSSGIRWLPNPTTAPIVQEIYQMRADGMSLVAIARELNRRGVRTSVIRGNGGAFWRPASIRALLANPIYRGQFIYNGSPYTRARAKRERRQIETITFERPECRLVSDELWYAANPTSAGWVRRGNTSPLAALIKCGACQGTLTVGHRGSRESLYCAACAQAASVGAVKHYPGTIVGGVVQAALRAAFESLLVEEDALETVKDGLRKRLACGVDGKLDVLQSRLSHARRSRDRYRELIGVVDDAELAPTRALHAAAASECKRLQAAINELTAVVEARKEDIVQAQISADPASLAGSLFATDMAPGRLRGLLARVFPRIVFRGKHVRFGGLFEIDIAPGIVLAAASDTPVLDDQTRRLFVQVDRGDSLPTEWHARVVKELPPVSWQAGTQRRIRPGADKDS